MTKDLAGFKERCDIAERCTPESEYRLLLARLHNDMLDAIDREKTRADHAERTIAAIKRMVEAKG